MRLIKLKKAIDKSDSSDIIAIVVWQQTEYGGIAQLGERLNGIQEVSGSIPLISTKWKALKLNGFGAFRFYSYVQKL